MDDMAYMTQIAHFIYKIAKCNTFTLEEMRQYFPTIPEEDIYEAIELLETINLINIGENYEIYL